MMNENKKGVKAVKHTKKAKGIEPPKPRNYVAKNAKMGGAGAHADKKKDSKQGKVKHKKMSSYMEHLETMLESTLRDKEDYHSKRKALDDLSRNKDVDQDAVKQRRLDLDKEASKKGIKEENINEEGLSPMKRMQIIQYLAQTMGYEVNYLELASDPELIDLYKQVKQEKGTVRKETMAGVGDMDDPSMNAVANEGWTHDSLAAQLFETENTYEDRLENLLAGKIAFMQATKK